jgi:hypothetical protein
MLTRAVVDEVGVRVIAAREQFEQGRFLRAVTLRS